MIGDTDSDSTAAAPDHNGAKSQSTSAHVTVVPANPALKRQNSVLSKIKFLKVTFETDEKQRRRSPIQFLWPVDNEVRASTTRFILPFIVALVACLICMRAFQIANDDNVIESIRRRVPFGDFVQIFKNHHGTYDELVSSSVAGTAPTLTLQSQDNLLVRYPVEQMEMDKVCGDDFAVVKSIFDGTTSKHSSLNALLNAKVESTTLMTALRKKFALSETLSGADKWQCPKCSKKVDATSTSWISRMPKVLTVQLKRFFCTSTFQTKIQIPVDFPLQGLDLSDFRTGPLIFQMGKLVCVCVRACVCVCLFECQRSRIKYEQWNDWL